MNIEQPNYETATPEKLSSFEISKKDLNETNKNEKKSPESLNIDEYLNTFHNNINPSAIISIERRPDEAVVIRCDNMYEYLKFGYSEDPKELEKIEQYKEIFEALSKPETIAMGTELMSKISEGDIEWFNGKLNAKGSAVPVHFRNGRKEAIVMMNDMPTRRMFNSDMTERTPEQLQKYDRSYQRTVEHEVRHTQYYNRYGRDLEEYNTILKEVKPLTPFQLREYHYDRYMKDEIIAHLENEVIEDEKGNIQINWNGIHRNLQKDDYRFGEIFSNADYQEEYRKVTEGLIKSVQKMHSNGLSPDKIMDKIHAVDVSRFMINEHTKRI